MNVIILSTASRRFSVREVSVVVSKVKLCSSGDFPSIIFRSNHLTYRISCADKILGYCQFKAPLHSLKKLSLRPLKVILSLPTLFLLLPLVFTVL